MHPVRRIEEIRSNLADGEEGAAEIRAAAALLERHGSVDRVLGAVGDPGFPGALIAAAEGSAPREERAWLTLVAAGSRRARQVLAWRAVQLLPAEQLVDVVMRNRRDRESRILQLAAASTAEAASAWGLLGHLRGSELRRVVRSHPVHSVVWLRARGARRYSSAAGPRLALA